MAATYSDAELEAYLDEGLDPQRSAEIEQRARDDKRLLARLAEINRRRNAGFHTVGEIWRRNQIGVPDRQTMSDYLLGLLPAEHQDYIAFRLEVLQCPYTRALHDDLAERAAGASAADQRRTRFYRSSAGLLRPGQRRGDD